MAIAHALQGIKAVAGICGNPNVREPLKTIQRWVELGTILESVLFFLMQFFDYLI